MKPITNLLAAGLLLIASSVFGQLTTNFAPASMPSTPIGNGVSLQLKVTNFTNVSSLQLPIIYNPAILRFDSIDSPALPNYIDTTIASHPISGKVILTWFPNPSLYPTGVTLPNGTAIITLRFTVVGAGTNVVNIGTAAPGIEVVNSAGTTLTVNYQSGGSTVVGSGGGGGSGCAGTGNPPAATTYTGFRVIANNIYIPQGQYGCVPITVNSFTLIQALTFAVHWDPSVLQFDCTRAYNLPDLATKIANPAPNTLVVAWDDASATGVSRADGAKMFDICFRAIGAPNAKSDIYFDGLGLPPSSGIIPEAINASSVNVWVNNQGPTGSGVRDTAFIVDPANTGCGPVLTADIDTLMATNTSTCIDVKVSNYFWMTNTEFSLSYDATKLTYQNIQLGTNPLTLLTTGPNSNFTTSSGLIKFTWNNTTAVNGVSLPNNTSIFSVCFNATLPAGTETPVSFTSSSCSPMSVLRKNIWGVPFVTNNGKVVIKASQLSSVASATNPNCSNGNGSLSVTTSGGTATAYAWAGPNSFTSNVQNPTNATVSGTYTVTVTFGANGTTTATTTLTVPTAISIPAQQVTLKGVACFGGNDGSVIINPAGGTAPYTYQWNGPNGFSKTTKDISSLNAGNYVVTITDSKQCTFVSTPFNVSSPQPVAGGQSTITPIKCFGGKDGALAIVPSGGIQPYIVAWSGPAGYTGTGTSITGLSAGSYLYTVTDSRSCTYVLPQQDALKVIEPTQINPVPGTIDPVKCFNTPTGSILLNVSGGTPGTNPPYSFVWKNTANNVQVSVDQNPANLAAGSYNVTVTDGNQCTRTLTTALTITAPTSALTVTSSTTPASCSGVLDGSITLSITGGWPGNGTTWTGPVQLPPIPNPTGVPGGTYTYTVTDSKGCVVTGPVTVGGAPDIAIGTPTVTNLLCAGTGNGCISITPSGGSNAPYTVKWSNTSLQGSTICGLTGGSYAPTVTDGAGCTKVFTAIVVTEPTLIKVDTVSTTKQNGVASNGAIDITVTGGITVNNYQYVWTGPSGFTANTQDISGLVAGTYTVIVRDDNNCAMTKTIVLEQNNLMLLTKIDTIINACNNDGCITFNIPNSAQAPFNFTWNGGSKLGVDDHKAVICGFAPGLYNITVTAANGLSVVFANRQITQLAQVFINFTASPPNGSSKNGSISIFPQFVNAAYIWNTGATTNIISSLDSGTYIVTITNLASGCTAVQSFPLKRIYPDFITSVDQQNSTCASALNGKILFNVGGGALPYTYAWSGPNGFTASTKEITGLAVGVYSGTVTDAIGQSKVYVVTLTAQSNLAITNVNETSSYNGFQVSGANTCDGAANLFFSGQSGAASILWSNGVTTATNNTLCGGVYSVSVTDGLGCVSVWSDELTAPKPILINATILNQPSCNGECDAIARVKVDGGVGPYIIKWSTNQVDQLSNSNAFSQAISLCGNAYTVTVTDASNISTTYQVVVPEPEVITLQYTVLIPHSFNACDGEIVLIGQGAVSPVSVTWAGGFGHSGTGQRASNLCAGEPVSFVLTDANGCTAVGVDTVPYPEDGCLRVRPVLTPGEQDGNNDYTFIPCIETVQNTVEIFNRWGQLVFETKNYNNYSNNFKGTTKTGQPLAEGVYFYILTFTNDDGIQEQRKGYINLLL